MIKIIKILLILFLLPSFPKIANSSASSTYLITNAAISSFDYETASKYFNNHDYDDFSASVLRKKIISFINSNELEEANSISKQLIELVNNSEDAWLVLLTYARLNNDFSTISKFKKLNDKNEFNIINYVFYENGQLERNNEDIAERLFNLVQKKDLSIQNYPKNIDYYLFYLNLALNFKPQFNEVFFIQAQVYQELKYYHKAEAIYNKIQPQHILYVEAQKFIAINKKKNNQFDEAEKLLIKLYELFPDNNSLIVLLADLYRTNKQYNKAVELYSSLINEKRINKDQLWRYYYLRGICYERSNKWKKAENDFLQSLKIEPEQPQVLNYLAYGWIEKNFHLERSIKMLEIAVKKNPESHYILDSLAWAHYKKNNFSKAVEIMEKVIEIAPGEAISLDHLGDIYFSLGRKREAKFMWIQALDLAEPEDNISESVQIKLDQYNAG